MRGYPYYSRAPIRPPGGPLFRLHCPHLFCRSCAALRVRLLHSKARQAKAVMWWCAQAFDRNHGYRVRLTIHALSVRRVHNFRSGLHNGCYAK